jgi:hypothetical protein
LTRLLLQFTPGQLVKNGKISAAYVCLLNTE